MPGVMITIVARIRALRCEVCNSQFVVESQADVERFREDHGPHLVTVVTLIDVLTPPGYAGYRLQLRELVPREVFPVEVKS